ncbi:MAG: TetR/AcrR family transcriptional regulator [Burkholderiales bacterium]|nr:MAG: TetR/AcrR family transcriptional regulator [Burkholderiales bacterium]
MTALQAIAARKRNAMTTRAALLTAATERFMREGYDSVSLREIASDAGVDVSLVSRYFGGKDELFADVLAACPSGTDIFEGDIATFGERLATKIVLDATEDADLTCLLIILRSASSPKAREAIRKSGEERFFGPIEKWLGGPDAKVRARLIADMVMGVMIDRVISDEFDLSAEERAKFHDRLARVLQSAIQI